MTTTVINDWHDLDAVRTDLSGDFELGQDLDSDTDGYDEHVDTSDGWEPIGDSDNPFTGSFDGQGYEINDLYIDRPNTDYVGLFGYTDTGGVVENIGVVDVNITGDNQVGGLFGRNNGDVSDSFSTGSVAGGGWDVGGLVGVTDGDVSDSYSTGSVTGGSVVGGLVGGNYAGNVENSYSTGSVTGDDYVGGLVGWNTEDVSDSYWDTETSGQTDSDGGTGLTTSEMTGSEAETNMNFDFSNDWFLVEEDEEIDHEITPEEDGYPILRPDDDWTTEQEENWIVKQLDVQGIDVDDTDPIFLVLTDELELTDVDSYLLIDLLTDELELTDVYDTDPIFLVLTDALNLSDVDSYLLIDLLTDSTDFTDDYEHLYIDRLTDSLNVSEEKFYKLKAFISDELELDERFEDALTIYIYFSDKVGLTEDEDYKLIHEIAEPLGLTESDEYTLIDSLDDLIELAEDEDYTFIVRKEDELKLDEDDHYTLIVEVEDELGTMEEFEVYFICAVMLKQIELTSPLKMKIGKSGGEEL